MRTHNLDSACAVEFALGTNIHGLGLVFCSERAEMYLPSANLDRSSPSISLFADTKNPRLVVLLGAAAILLVFCLVCFAQVAEPVISPVAIKVVYFINRPNPVNIKPRQPMGKVSSTKELNPDVASAIGPSCCITGTHVGSDGWSSKPRECARSCVVGEHTPQNIPTYQFRLFHTSPFLLSG